MSQAVVVFLAMAGGFISLSYELLWARCFTVAVQGRAYAFAMLLALFLTGIAVGSKLAAKLSERFPRQDVRQLRAIAAFISASSLAGWSVIPVMAWLLSLHLPIPPFTALYTVGAAAVLLGAQLPLLANYGIEPDDRAGIWMSYLYGANIVGSVAGSLLTGFVLTDHFSLESIVTWLTVAGLGLGLTLWGATRPSKRALGGYAIATLVASLLTIVGTPWGYDTVYERLFYGQGYDGQAFKGVIENKSGVIALTQADEVYSGGVYDGTFSVDLVDDVNGLSRPFALSAFHPEPKTVLAIGLATGSWARVLAEHPQVERLLIVEINPGFLKIIDHYPVHQPLLDDPRVEIVIDDARRWLNANDEKFDAIVSNTTYHWRSHVSGILSVEFMELMRSRLKPGGIVMVNTTGSRRVVRSSTEVFEHTNVFLRSVVASDAPLHVDWPRMEQTLLDYRIGGRPVIDRKNPQHVARLEEIKASLQSSSDQFFDENEVEQMVSDVEKITDDNMGHEWNVALF